MLVYKHSSIPPPEPRRRDRRSGARAERLREALDEPLAPEPMTPEALAEAKRRRARWAERRPHAESNDPLGVLAVVLLVGALCVAVAAVLVWVASL